MMPLTTNERLALIHALRSRNWATWIHFDKVSKREEFHNIIADAYQEGMKKREDQIFNLVREMQKETKKAMEKAGLTLYPNSNYPVNINKLKKRIRS